MLKEVYLNSGKNLWFIQKQDFKYDRPRRRESCDWADRQVGGP